MARVLEPYKGDLDGMIKRRVIRVLTVQNPVLYFVDRGREVGITYESIKAFEKQLNQKLGNKIVMVYVVAIPVARDQLIPMLLSGRGDIAAAQLTITPERQKLVDFSLPGATGVREVLVTGPGAPPVASIADLSGKEVYIRPSSSYAEHIAKLNKRFADEGKAPLKVTPAPEVLEDGDILEMVSAGLVPATVVDEVTADLYTQVFPNLKKHADIASPPGDIAWAFRKGSPKLAAAVNAFVKTHKEGTLAGNVLINKYLKTTQWVRNARSDEDRKRFVSMIETLQEVRRPVRPRLPAHGRPGLPGVAARPVEAQPRGRDRRHAGHARHGARQGREHPGHPEPGQQHPRGHQVQPLGDGQLLQRARRHAASTGGSSPSRPTTRGRAGWRACARRPRPRASTPNMWFNNVELVAAKRIGRETVTYVSNIYKYYLAYQMMVQGDQARREAKAAAAKR